MTQSLATILAASCLLAGFACTANVEDPTVNQQGRGGNTTCISSCDTDQTSCVAKCTDDACKVSCQTTHTSCVASCSKDGG
jgi:hypothetical protein